MDIVRPLKFENPASGGIQFDLYPTEIDEKEDYPIQKGILLENENTIIDRDTDGSIKFTDTVNGSKTLKGIIFDTKKYAISMSISLGGI